MTKQTKNVTKSAGCDHGHLVTFSGTWSHYSVNVVTFGHMVSIQWFRITKQPLSWYEIRVATFLALSPDFRVLSGKHRIRVSPFRGVPQPQILCPPGVRVYDVFESYARSRVSYPCSQYRIPMHCIVLCGRKTEGSKGHCHASLFRCFHQCRSLAFTSSCRT